MEPVVEPVVDSVEKPKESEDKDKVVESTEKEQPEESSLLNDAPTEPPTEAVVPNEEIDKET